MIGYLLANDIENVVLDVDDTLYLERDYVRSGFLAVGHAIGMKTFGELCWSYFEAGIRGNTFDLAREALNHDPRIWPTPKLVTCYREHSPNISLCEDAAQFLRHCQHPMAIITDGPLASQRAKVTALGLDKRIRPVIYTAEHACPKPSPQAYIMAAGTSSPQRCAYIADNPAKDFLAPHAMGWKTIRIRRSLGLHTAIPSGSDVDVEFDRF